MQPVLCTRRWHRPTLAFLAKRHAKVKNWKAINTARAHGASQLHWSRKGVPHSVHPNEIRRRTPPANTATNRNAHADTHDTHWQSGTYNGHREHQQTQHARQHEWYTATSPTNEHGRNSQAHHRGGVTQGPIASCGISVVRSGICHVAGDRTIEPAPLPVSGTIMSFSPYRQRRHTPRMSWPIQDGVYVMADSGSGGCHVLRIVRDRWCRLKRWITWYARSLGKSCGCAGLDDAELVPSDGVMVQLLLQRSRAARRGHRWTVVGNLTWLAISKMLFDDEIGLKWGVAYYYN